MKALYALTPEEHATVLAALRHYQGAAEDLGRLPATVADIATNDGTVTPLLAFEVGQLCEDLNNHGLSAGEALNIVGADEDNPYVAAAQNHRLISEGTLEVTAPAIVSPGDDGAYMMAWLWIDNVEFDIPAGSAA